MRFENYLNEGFISNLLLKSLKNYTIDKALIFLEKQWKKAIDIIRKNGKEKEALQILNAALKTNYKSLNQFDKKNMRKLIPEEIEINNLNEDLSHWWEMIKDEGFPTLSFYPALTAWIELGKMFDGIDAVNWKKVAVYGAFWAALVTGKYIKSFFKWKKEHPEEYYKERPKLAKKHGIKIKEL